MQSELNPDKALARKWMSEFDKDWVFSLRNVDEKRWHTYITSTFMHDGILHLGFNMMCLWGFGKPAALLFGAPRFLLLYFGFGIAGAMLQTWHWRRTEPRHSNPPAVGASGCIFGLLGAMTVFSPKMTVLFSGFLPMRMWQSSLITVILSLSAIQPQTLPWVGHVDHLGGMAFGVVFCKSSSWAMIDNLRVENVETQLLTSLRYTCAVSR
jgi:membrane associated rhomboid family serine protease